MDKPANITQPELIQYKKECFFYNYWDICYWNRCPTTIYIQLLQKFTDYFDWTLHGQIFCLTRHC